MVRSNRWVRVYTKKQEKLVMEKTNALFSSSKKIVEVCWTLSKNPLARHPLMEDMPPLSHKNLAKK
jgi:hypothetical protein